MSGQFLSINKTSFIKIMSISFLMMSVAAAQTDAPSSLGGSSNNGKITSSMTKVQVENKKAPEKKQSMSKREKKAAKGSGLRMSEIEILQIQKQLGSSLTREISVGEKILPTLSKTSQQRPEVLRRLIEVYHQQAIFLRADAMVKYEAAYKKWDAAGRTGTEPEFSDKVSRAWTSKVIQRAQQFITEYSTHKFVDEEYFQIAYAMEEIDQHNESAGYYSKLVQKFPNSKRIPDAYFALGQYYFEKQDFKKAIDSYKQTERYSRSNIYPWAVYKIAWCYYNLQDYRNSLGQFQKVVQLSQSASSQSSLAKQRLKDEALSEMVNVYAELNDLDGAERYFMQVGGEKFYGNLLLRLATIMREKGDFTEAIAVLKRFVNRNPNAFTAAEVQMQIVDVSTKLSDKKILWAEVKLLISTYRKDASWGTKNASEPTLQEISERVSSLALTTAKFMHSEYQRTGNKALATETETGYGLYLTYYGARPEALEVRFLLGEILYATGRYSEAAKNFVIIADLKEKSKYFNKAADYFLSASYLPITAELTKLRTKKIEYGGAPQNISAGYLDYLKACDKYATWYPKDKKVSDCQVDAAEIYVKHNQFVEAEKRLLIIARTHADKAEGKISAAILLRMAVKDPKKPTEPETEKLILRADEFSKIPQYKQGDLGKQLAALQAEFRFSRTLKLEKSGNFSKAGVEFEKIALEGPNAKDADKAWFNAGVNYRKSGDVDKSIVAFTKVYTAYPQSVSSADALLAVIAMHEDRFELQKAADTSAIFVKKYPKNPSADKVQSGTCFLYDALNVSGKAVQMCGDVINAKKNGSRDDKNLAMDAARSIANIHYRNQKYRDYIAFVDNTILKLPFSVSEQMEFLAKAADAEQKAGMAAAANMRRARIEKLYESNKSAASGLGLGEVAKLSFQRQWPVFEKYKAMRIEARKPDGSDLMETAIKKKDAIKPVEAGFSKVAKIGSPEWSVAALYVIGYSYELLAQDYNNPPRPAKATDSDMKTIKAKFGELANGFKDVAHKSYATALGIAGKASVNTEYSKKTLEAMSRLSPNEFRKLDEWTPALPFVGGQWLEIGATKKVIEQLGGSK